MDATRHHCLDERPEVLVLDGSLPGELVVGEPRPVRAEGHRLILEIALAALITDGTVERVVDEQKLHDTLPGFACEFGIRVDLPAVHDGHGAGRDGLGRLLDLDEAHSAVAGDREALVIAKPRDFDTDHGGGLKRQNNASHSEKLSFTNFSENTNLKDSGSRINQDLLAVDEALDLLWSSSIASGLLLLNG